MKILFLTAAAAALILTVPAAFADDDHHGGGHPGGGGQEHHAPAPAHTEHMAAPVHTDHAATPSHAMTMGGPAGSHAGSHGHNGMATTTAAPTGFGNNGNHMHGGNTSHVTINFNRRNVTASHHFHYSGGAYRGPSGYHYQRWAYGQTFPSIYFARDYWINDYSDYGLVDPPDGAVWVRYGNDAVLVDEDSGEILEVVYNQFY